MGKPSDVMVFFVIDGALELGGILNLAEVYPNISRFPIFTVS